jgi:hypothetical protein
VDCTLVHFGELWPTYQKSSRRVKMTHPKWLSVVYGGCHAHFLDLVASKVTVVRQTVKQLQDVITR